MSDERMVDVAGQHLRITGRAVPRLSRRAVFAYDLLVLIALLVVGVLYLKFTSTFVVGSPAVTLAQQSMWFGALGGVMISLKGIYDHSDGPDGWIVPTISGILAGRSAARLLV